MCELFAISSKVPTKTTFSLEEFARHGGKTAQHTDGWGLAFYDGSFAQIFHEAEPSAYSKWMQFLQGHQTPTRRLISHIRRASVGERALRNTQPFSRELGGKRHVFCHNGDLKDAHKKLELGRFRAIGDTDSEHAFCFLLSKLEPLWRDHPPSLDDRTSVLKKTFSSFSKNVIAIQIQIQVLQRFPAWQSRMKEKLRTPSKKSSYLPVFRCQRRSGSLLRTTK